LQVSLRETCGLPAAGVTAVRITITPLGGAGRPVANLVTAVVRYLRDRSRPGTDTADASRPGSSVTGTRAETGTPTRYYADGGDGPGRWLGRGAIPLQLAGSVDEHDFAAVLGGRDPRTGERLVTAQGSAGRRPRLGTGTHTRLGPHGDRLYDLADAAVTLGVTVAETRRMTSVGTRLASLPPQPPGSYLIPVRVDGEQWVTEDELTRCAEERAAGTSPEQAAATGPPDELLPLAEAARIAGVTKQYLRRLARRYETNRATIDAAVAAGRHLRLAYLVAHRGPRGQWLIRRDDLSEFLRRRRPRAVRIGFDLTLTTEKSLGVLALLSPSTTRREVLDAIRAGNDLALRWMEAHSAAAREKGEVIPVKGWTVASFRHHTSRALDPFPHHHNVVANTVEDHHGIRRTLDARGLYRDAQAASALATAEMRYQLARRLGVRWRPGRSSWEIAGIPEPVLREFSRRRTEIEDALRELEEAIGRGSTLDEVDQVILETRADKISATIDELLAGWWARAEAIGFTPADLAACVGGRSGVRRPDRDAVFSALAAPDGLCENVSVFNRGDVLHALVNLTDPSSDPDDPQPLVVPADELERLADDFLTSAHVEQLTDGSDGSLPRYSTGDMLAVQNRIVDRYRRGLHRGAGLARSDALAAALAENPRLTAEQRGLVQAFCSSGHRIQCAIGHPGAGKTTSMTAARRAWEASGWRVLGAAVKGEAARTLAATAGITTETLAWYLAQDDPLHSPLDARTILVVDEASTISDRDLDRLRWLAAATGATLRLVGDSAQHGAVEAGGMFRVLCERHPRHTPELTETHRLQDPRDRAAAEYLRAGEVAKALDELDAAGHLHIVDDDLHAYTDVLARWWRAHQAGHHHPMVNRRNDVRRALNRLAHQLRRAAGEIGIEEITAAEDRRYSVGDRVIARVPNRRLHPPDDPGAYVRNGATGTITRVRQGDTRDHDGITVDFDDLGTVDLPRRFFDEHDIDHHARRDVGIDHAYAVTSYAVTGATYAVSTSRIDETSSRAETYVDITRGRQANHLYLTRHRHEIDHETLPRVPPDPIDQAISHQLATSQGERTAWELRQHERDGTAGDTGVAVGL
jgi:conjugative relaxase-like TrwC/TraI family protein